MSEEEPLIEVCSVGGVGRCGDVRGGVCVRARVCVEVCGGVER